MTWDPCFVERELQHVHPMDRPVAALVLSVARGKASQTGGRENLHGLLYREEEEMKGSLEVRAKHDVSPGWKSSSVTAWRWVPVHAQKRY